MQQARSEAGEDTLRHLEASMGRSFRTREDIRAYLQDVDTGLKSRIARVARYWEIARQATWLVLLLFAFLQYYLIEVLLEITSLHEMTVFLPVGARGLRSSLESLLAFC